MKKLSGRWIYPLAFSLLLSASGESRIAGAAEELLSPIGTYVKQLPEEKGCIDIDYLPKKTASAISSMGSAWANVMIPLI